MVQMYKTCELKTVFFEKILAAWLADTYLSGPVSSVERVVGRLDTLRAGPLLPPVSVVVHLTGTGPGTGRE